MSYRRPFARPTRAARSALVVALMLVTAVSVASCKKPVDPEKTEDWKVDDCVVIDGDTDLDIADCNGTNDGRIVKTIGPLVQDDTCPGGSRKVREDQVSGDGSFTQEMRICLSKRPTGADADGKYTAAGDPAKIVEFNEPATEVTDGDKLIAYVLPGMDGPAVECVTGDLEDDDVLEASNTHGASLVSAAVLDCFDGESLGRLLTMYAFAVGERDTSNYDEYVSCVSEAFSDVTTNQVRRDVTDLFEARLDFEGAVGSPAAAVEIITDQSSC